MILLCVLAVLGAGALLWRDAKPMLVRLVVVHESRYAKPEQIPAEPMPAYLEEMAMQWDSEQAREDTLTAMREAYHELHDWTKVAAKFTGGFFGSDVS